MTPVCKCSMKEKPICLDELEKIMTETKTSLAGFIYRMVKQPEITQDIFQETWLNVVRHLDSYDRNQPFKPWLFRIARNLSINHLNRQKRREKKEQTLGDIYPTHSLNPGEVQADEERLMRCLDEIPSRFREVIRLRFFEEMSFEDISTVLNVPVGTVYSRSNRGLKHLRKRWEKLK